MWLRPLRVLLVAVSLVGLSGAPATASLETLAQDAETRPNLLWITSEDNGPHLGCYGDAYATTPVLDALAARGMLYRHAWSNAPVCAPARTTIITGIHATTLGAEHMRSEVRLPDGFRLFPEFLRAAGYYCTNRSKTDYNVVEPGQTWDVSSRDAHWRGRTEGQPFFSVFNITTTHEGQIRKRPHEAVHDTARVRVPAYHPDVPEVRQDWAQYYDKLTEMDQQVGRILAELDADGLRESTIVVYFGDHGPGMPRCKRSPYDSGLAVPLIVSIPERFGHLAPEEYAAGAASERLVSFVDLAPTMLRLAGLASPWYHAGAAFLGAKIDPEPQVLLGYRGRMDERYDLVRSVRDRRWVYRRNYLPQRPYGQHIAYMFETPTTAVWKERFDRGELAPPVDRFWRAKPAEELYDLESDPDEVNDLARSKEHAEVLAKLRSALTSELMRTRDLGFFPEDEVHRLAQDTAPMLMATQRWTELQRAMLHAEAATSPTFANVALPFPEDQGAASRYWSAVAATVRGADGTQAVHEQLRAALADESPSVRIAAAEALGLHGDERDRVSARRALLAAANVEEQGLYVALHALNVIDALGARMSEDLDALRALPRQAEGVPKRLGNYVPRLLDDIIAGLEAPEALEREPEVPAPSEVVYRSVGEIELTLEVHSPAGAAPESGWPCVVFFHGGGWTGGDPSQFADHCAHLARRGVIGITAQYRLGKTHGTTPFECVADGKAAVRFVRANAGELAVDPARIAAGGGSAGGHVAAAVATVSGSDDEPQSPVSCRPDALVLFNPVFDNGPGGWGHERLGERWNELSPLHNLDASAPPTLVMLGTEDALVPVATGERYRDAMLALGLRCELALYEGQGHGFFNRSRGDQMYAQTVADMDAFLAELGWTDGASGGR